MGWVISTESADYENAAGAFVRSRSTEHTVLLSVAESIRRQGRDAFGERPPECGWWTGRDGAVGAAFPRTPPHPVLLTDLPADAAASPARCYARHGPR
jgi:hypothetical protein